MAGAIWRFREDLSFDVSFREARIDDERVGGGDSDTHGGSLREVIVNALEHFRHMTSLGLITLLISAVVVTTAVSAEGLARDALPLTLIADIPLPGTVSRFDYQSYDPGRHWLFIAHLGDGAVLVFDTKTRRVVKDIPGISEVHGVLVEPSLGRVFATATGQRQVAIIDEGNLRVIARSPGGTYPDGLAYVPSVHKLYVSDETGQRETVIDTHTNRRVAAIPLGGEAGNTQYDPVSGRIFVNVQSRHELVAIDVARDAIDRRYSLQGCDNNHGLYIDPAIHMAYVACAGNDRLLVLDLNRMHVLQSHAVGRDPDVLDFDPGLRLLYVASESGTVSVFRREGKVLQKLGEGRVAPHVHSIAVDPQTHLVYLPLENVNGKPVLRVMAPIDVQ